MYITGASIQVRQAINNMSARIQQGGLTASAAQARALAQGNIYQQLIRQSTQLAYLDVIALLSIGAPA